MPVAPARSAECQLHALPLSSIEVLTYAFSGHLTRRSIAMAPILPSGVVLTSKPSHANETHLVSAERPVRPTALPRDCRRLRRRFWRDANANADLVRSVDKDIVVRLKWGETEYKGRLVSIDSYMNIQLRDTEEYIDQKMTGTLGQVLIR
ncbi:LSM domain-containing protein [Ilyonectria robusta]